MTILTCPECGKEFDVDEALLAKVQSNLHQQHELELSEAREEARAQAEAMFTQELETTLTKQAEEASLTIELLNAQIDAKDKSNAMLTETVKELCQQIATYQESETTKEVEFQRRINEAVLLAKQELKTEYNLKLAESEEKLKRMKSSLEDAEAKLMQGSEQIRGEVFETDMYACLSQSFVDDVVERVRKGKSGPDVIQTVMIQSQPCGKIIWEMKNAKWNKQWIRKLRDDMAEASANFGVLVSTDVPVEIATFGIIDGVLVTKPSVVIPLANILREGIIEVGRVKAISLDMDERMACLQKYIISPEFRSKIERMLDSFKDLNDELEKEKRSTYRRWEKQKRCLQNLTSSTAGMYGEFQAILGPSVEDIPLLEGEAESES